MHILLKVASTVTPSREQQGIEKGTPSIMAHHCDRYRSAISGFDARRRAPDSEIMTSQQNWQTTSGQKDRKFAR
jgi:hypothetical protein